LKSTEIKTGMQTNSGTTKIWSPQILTQQDSIVCMGVQ